MDYHWAEQSADAIAGKVAIRRRGITIGVSHAMTSTSRRWLIVQVGRTRRRFWLRLMTITPISTVRVVVSRPSLRASLRIRGRRMCL